MKIKALLLCVLSAILFSGCQLALPEKENNYADRLVGVFVTSQHLDLFDFEGYLNDNLNGFSGGNITLTDNQTEYEGRLYASFEGDDYQKVAFGDVEGIPFFTAEFSNESNETCTYTFNGDNMVDGHYKVAYSDEEDKMTLDGTIYIVPKEDRQVHYINPVYQSVDGKIYAKSGSGMSVNRVQSQGNVMSQKLEETVTISENGVNKNKTTIINIAVHSMLPPQKTVIIEMDNNNNVLSATEYIPGQLPESISVNKTATYIIFETHKTDFDNKPIIERKLYSKDDTSVTSFFEADSNILSSQFTELIW